MKSIVIGSIFWVVLLGVLWLVRPKSRLMGITMERWSIAQRLVTVLVLAGLIGSSSFLMTLCPMWNGETTARLMEKTKALAGVSEAAASTDAGEAAASTDVSEATASTDAGEAAASTGSGGAAASTVTGGAAEQSTSAAATAGREEWMKTAAAAMDPATLSDDPDRYAIKNKNQYELMADAILAGKFYIDYGDMDRRLLEMPNPYDPAARRELGVRYHWDHAFYKGHYYMYFGVVPVFLLFIPFKLITGASLTTFHATQIFVGLAMVGLFAFFRLLSKRFFPKLSFMVYLFLGAAVSVTSMVHCIAKPAMYMTAFAAGFCMEIWSIYFYFKAVWATENENRAVFRAFLGALLGALAFGCRPSIALANLIVIPCLIVFLREHKFTGRLFMKLLAAASPYLVIGALLMLYNYARFDNPFEFGQSYQLTVADQTSYGGMLSRLSARKLVNGVIYFLVRSEDLVSDFPHITEGGVFFSYPVFVTGLFALTSQKVRSSLRSNKLVLFLLGGIVSIGAIILMDGVWTPYLLERYREDMMWLLGMLVFLCVGMRYAESSGAVGSVVSVGESSSGEVSGAVAGEAETSELIRSEALAIVADPCEEAREFSSVVCILAIYSMLVCAFVFVYLDMKHFLPEQIVLIKKIIGALTFGL